MKRYEEYKPSLAKWVPSIPQNWKQVRGKNVFYNQKQLNADNTCENILSLTLKGVIGNNKENPIGLSPKDYCTYQIFEPNDLVFKLIDLENISTSRVGLVPERGIMSPAYIRLCQRGNENIRYMYYQYFDLYLRNIFNGLGAGVRSTLTASDLLNLPIMIPHRAEQDQIVRYLDWQVSKINRLIAAKRKRIELVKEHFSVRIANIVCNGLKPNTPMRETGIDYIGAIPSHWTVLQNKRLFKSMNRTFQGIPTVLSLSQKDGLIPYSEMAERSLHTSSYENWQLVCPNDLVLNRFKAHLGVFFASKYTGIVTFHYGVYEAKMPLVAKYYEVLYHTPEYCRVYAGQSRGMTVGLQNLSDTNFYSTYTVYPPNEEQREIVTEIEQIEKQQSSIIAGVNRQIEKLQEFRTRLISDVVTGQVDVRGIEVPEFEYVGEADVAEEQDEESEVG